MGPSWTAGLSLNVPLEGFGDKGIGRNEARCSGEDGEKFREPGAIPTTERLAHWLCPWKTVPVVSVPDRQQAGEEEVDSGWDLLSFLRSF